MDDSANLTTQLHSSDSATTELDERLQEYYDEFATFCKERRIVGEQEYGATAFLENDLVQYIAEELADMANYAMFMYAKIKLIGDMLDEDSTDSTTVDASTEHTD